MDEYLLEQQRNWLSNIPKELAISPEIFVFHGLPEADDDFLLEQTIGGRKCLGKIDEIEQKLWKLNFKVFLCGHSHLSRCVRLRNGSLIINPGSVGLQAYEESCEVPYRVENGSPHARYAILEQRNQQWTPSFRLIEYDWDSAAKKSSDRRTIGLGSGTFDRIYGDTIQSIPTLRRNSAEIYVVIPCRMEPRRDC